MTIEKVVNGEELVVCVEGRLDTMTSPEFEKELKPAMEGMSEVILDFKDLEYISSAGLRVLLSAQKVMMRQGSLVIRNCSDEIMEIFEVTGFTDILTIE